MKKILALNGSTRKFGNTSLLLQEFIKGVKQNSNLIEEIQATELNLEYCRGCLRCNLIGRCSIQNDDWNELSANILEADVLVFASPIYFHYLTAPLKKVIDRFRSFVHVQITETAIDHTPRVNWNKDFVLILSMGSSDDIDAKPVIELFEYMKEVLGADNRLHVIKGTRLAVIKQVSKSEEELAELYPKLNLPDHLIHGDYKRNQTLLKSCYDLGEMLSS